MCGCVEKNMRRVCFAIAINLGLILSAPASAAQKLPGPFDFEVLKVIDGDTFRARIPIWLGQTVEVKIRLKGVDTPEIKGKCAAETKRAREAKNFAAQWLRQDGLRLTQIHHGTYAGRVLGTVQKTQASGTGETLSAALLAEGLAKPYRGRRATWCP
jgi:endonuclease YncB( thermonuclease family)